MSTTAVKERPIICSSRSVRAIQSDVKTHTRRVVTSLLQIGAITGLGRSDTTGYDWHCRDKRMLWHDLRHNELIERCPYGVSGDRLWVKETWAVSAAYDSYRPSQLTPHVGSIAYKAGGGKLYDQLLDRTCFDVDGERGRWRSPLFMPRWISRLTLEVTDVRVERLRQMPFWAVQLEGYPGYNGLDEFVQSWNKLNAKRGFSWAQNPWVWVIEFRRMKESE